MLDSHDPRHVVAQPGTTVQMIRSVNNAQDCCRIQGSNKHRPLRVTALGARQERAGRLAG